MSHEQIIRDLAALLAERLETASRAATDGVCEGATANSILGTIDIVNHAVADAAGIIWTIKCVRDREIASERQRRGARPQINGDRT